ncbi:MAG: PH domain-containing protein [Clostridiales Family XIII bacterium]|jgi:membrane protein YdbS with pleckstrin-like domain|nr:PH domain-containing protein [Clostridiales Family XIII bacterium]
MRTLPSEHLDKRIKSVWRVNSLIGTFILALIVTVVIFLLVRLAGLHLNWLPAPIIVFLVWRILSFAVFPRIRYARWRYELLQEEIDIMKGLLFVTRTIIPMIRVQYTDTSQGPVLRAFGLSSVTIYTAGGSEDIPGLTPEDADALRDRIIALAKAAKEDI